MVGRYIVPAALRTVFAESTNATEAIMDRRTQTVCRWPLLLAGLLLVLGGCANLRLPAIDPSGRRIFLPTPSHTTINTPGQSGDPDNRHYRDLFDLWAADRYFPVFYTRAKIEAVADERVVLVQR